jgi:hypothetical protein
LPCVRRGRIKIDGGKTDREIQAERQIEEVEAAREIAEKRDRGEERQRRWRRFLSFEAVSPPLQLLL